MRFWTVQPLSVWQDIQEHGFCHVDRAKRGIPDYVPPCYLWLVEQLQRRHPGFTGRLPWWLYCGKPDLRWVRWTRRLGEVEVRLELQLPPDRECHFLIEDWDRVYCGSWLFRSPKRPRSLWYDYEERRRLDDLPLEDYPQPIRTLLQRSWQRLFDPHRLHGYFPPKMEGVVETIYRADVRCAHTFVGCHPTR